IGENSPTMRARITERLAWLGIGLDATANNKGSTLVSKKNSRIPLYVIPTNEELMIARHTLELLSAQRTPKLGPAAGSTRPEPSPYSGPGLLMYWKQSYYFRDYLKSSLWVVPLIAIPFALVATRLLHRSDIWLGWRFLDFGKAGAEAMLNTIVTATL